MQRFQYWILSFIICLFWIANITTLSAQTSLSLSQAVETGLKNSFDIRISQTNTAIADRRLSNAKKERMPSVDVFAQQVNSIINDRSPTTFINDFYRDRNLAIGVDGEWIAFDRFVGKTNQQQYKIAKEESENQEKLAIENTIYDIVLAYYDALIKKEAVAVAEQSRAISKERLEDAQLKEKVGNASRYEVLRFENALLLDATNILQKERALEAAMIQLNTAMGNRKKVRYQLSSPLDYEVQDYELASLYRLVEQRNKNLLNQNLAVEAAKLNTTASKNASLPVLSINTGLSQRFNGTSFPEIPRIRSNAFQFYLRFAATYNLFDGGSRRRAIQERVLQEEIEVLQTNQLKTTLYQELQNAVDSYQQHIEILRAMEKLLQNLELNKQLEQDRFTNGFSSALDFRTVQLEYLTTQFAKLETVYQLISNELTILQLTGTLDKKKWSASH